MSFVDALEVDTAGRTGDLGAKARGDFFADLEDTRCGEEVPTSSKRVLDGVPEACTRGDIFRGDTRSEWYSSLFLFLPRVVDRGSARAAKSSRHSRLGSANASTVAEEVECSASPVRSIDSTSTSSNGDLKSEERKRPVRLGGVLRLLIFEDDAVHTVS